MDVVLLEDTVGVSDSAVNGSPPQQQPLQGMVILPAQNNRGPEVASSWVHPELKRVRVEMIRRSQDSGKWSDLIESKQRIAQDRVDRLTSMLSQKKAALEELTRQRDQLHQEVESETAVVSNLCDVQKSFAVQLAHHKSFTSSVSASTALSAVFQGGAAGGSSAAATSAWFEGPEQCDDAKDGGPTKPPSLFDGPYALVPTIGNTTGSHLTNIPHARVQVIGVYWQPLACRVGPWQASQRDALKRWLDMFAPIAEVNNEGFVHGIARIDQACLMENTTGPCTRIGCRYQHLLHTVAHLQIVCRHLLRGVSALFDRQSVHICRGADFVAESYDALAKLSVHSSTPKDIVVDQIESLLISMTNHVIEAGWYTAMNPTSVLDPSYLHNSNDGGLLPTPQQPMKRKFYRPPTVSTAAAVFAAPVYTSPQPFTSQPGSAMEDASHATIPRRILERIFEKNLQYLSGADERNALEHVALQCSTTIATFAATNGASPSDEEVAAMIVKCAMSAFEEAPLAILWRLAARAMREVNNHSRAEWLLQTAMNMFPVDPHVRVELVHTMFAADDAAPGTNNGRDFVRRVMGVVSTSLDILTHQANALTLSKQKPALVTVISKAIAYLLAYTAVQMAPKSREAATALLTCAVDAPGRYCIGPLALQNLAVLLALTRSVGTLEGIADILPIASISDVCFTLSSKATAGLSPAAAASLSDATAKVMQQQLNLMARVGEAGAHPKVLESTRSAAYAAMIRASFVAHPELVGDILSKLDMEPRTFYSEVWGQYFLAVAENDGRELALNTLKTITVQPHAPMWLQLRLASTLAMFHCPLFLHERLQAVVASMAKGIGLITGNSNIHQSAPVTISVLQTLLTPDLVADPQAHHQKLKQTGLNWMAFVICAASQRSSPADALMLLRAIPRNLLTIQLDNSIVLCFEQIGYCLRAMADDLEAVSPSGGSARQPVSIAGLPRLDTFRDIVRSELELLKGTPTSQWLSAVDWHAEQAITTAHMLTLEIYRNLPSLCPAVRSIQNSVAKLRCEVLDVAQSVGALHPLLLMPATAS